MAQVGEDMGGKPLKAIEKKAPPSKDDDFGLGVAQIVITAATPMEEIERPFPGEEVTADDVVISKESTETEKSPSNVVNETDDRKVVAAVEESQTTKVTEVVEDSEEKSTVDDQPADSAPFPISSSSGSEADSTSGPSTADNSQSLPSRANVVEMQPADEQLEMIPEKMLIGGRASIPDELQPDQLEKLQNLKESNA